MNQPKVFVHRHSHITIILLSVMVGVALTAVVLYYPRAHTPVSAQQPEQPPVAASPGLETAFEEVAQRVLPAVVSIIVQTRGGTAGSGDELDLEELFRDNPFFEPFFKEFRREGSPKSGPRVFPRGKSFGSGWIYSDDGYIVTNSHVVRGAEKISVKLHDKPGEEKEYPAKLIGSDPKTEIAVIKVDVDRKLPTLSFGSSQNARVGQWVMAVGAPFQLEQTVTVGVISAMGRFLPGQSRFIRIGDVIQTDASINPGNSGGPLVNLRGEVIGVNVAIVSNSLTPGNVGIGFAIPADTAASVTKDLIQFKKVPRGWLGIKIKDLNENMRDFYGVAEGGVLVESVDEGGPAANSDLKADDVIVAVDGQPVKDTWELQKAIGARKPQTEITLDVLRDKQPVQVKVTLGEMPGKYAGLEDTEKPVEEVDTESPLGLTVENLTPSNAKKLGTKVTKGVVVTEVQPDGPSDGKLEPGDIITQINKTRINNVEDYKAALDAARKEGRKYVVVGFLRKVDDEWMSSREDIEPNW